MMNPSVSISATQLAVAAGALGTRFAPFIAPAISIAILAAAVFALHAIEWGAVLAMVPGDPLFWLVFVLAHGMPLFTEWLIYRRIWGIPRAAIVTIMRKSASNDLLFGYLGETYLYAWARRAGKTKAIAFGSVKDVTVLSAAVGSSATLVVALLTAPLLGQVRIGVPPWAVAFAITAVVAPPLVAIFGRRAVFHLPGRMLREITAIHAARAATGLALTAMLWHLAAPGIALRWWVTVSALKLVLSRLPFVSNKDLVFAGATALLFGHRGDIATLMAMMASLALAAHIAIGVAASASGLIAPLAVRLRPASPQAA